MMHLPCVFLYPDLLPLIDQLPYVTACTTTTARKQGWGWGGAAGESFLLFSVHSQLGLERSACPWVVSSVEVLCNQVEMRSCIVVITLCGAKTLHCWEILGIAYTWFLHARKVNSINPAPAYNIHVPSGNTQGDVEILCILYRACNHVTENWS